MSLKDSLRVMVVDDMSTSRGILTQCLDELGVKNYLVENNGQSAFQKLATNPVHLVLSDYNMPGMDGLELLHAIRERDEHLPVILMTAYGSIEKAVEAMRTGAWDFVTKPFHGDELQLAVSRALEHGAIRKENQTLRAAGQSEETDMVASAPAMQNIVAQLEVIAEANADVLLTGESGVGKEVAAKWIHEHSPRKDGGFLAVNCAALPGPLLESELFGHEKGAFTGAAERRAMGPWNNIPRAGHIHGAGPVGRPAQSDFRIPTTHVLRRKQRRCRWWYPRRVRR